MFKRGPGQPRKEMDEKQLEQLVGMGCTDAEISAFFGISARKIQEKRKVEPYKKIFETSREKYRISLRRAQMRVALAGNASMLIWLGKTLLGQKDAMKLSNDPDDPITFPKIEITYVKPQE